MPLIHYVFPFRSGSTFLAPSSPPILLFLHTKALRLHDACLPHDAAPSTSSTLGTSPRRLTLLLASLFTENQRCVAKLVATYSAVTVAVDTCSPTSSRSAGSATHEPKMLSKENIRSLRSITRIHLILQLNYQVPSRLQPSTQTSRSVSESANFVTGCLVGWSREINYEYCKCFVVMPRCVFIWFFRG